MPDERSELLERRDALLRELREVEHGLHLAPEASLPGGAAGTLLGMVAEYSLDLISVHEATGEFVYVSPNAAQLFGWSAGELEGRSPYELVHPEDLPRITGSDAAPQAEAGVRYRLRGPGGEYRWAETRSRATGDGRYLVAITRDVQREQALLEELERSSRHDVLTGLLNRRGMDEALEREVERTRRQETELAVLYFDVDHFKEINDTQGHAAGDEVLRRVGAVVAARKRIGDYAARWGGDEFLLVLPDTATAEAVRAARRISRGLAEALPAVTLSYGVSTTSRAATVQDLLRQADEALYAVKRRGGAGLAVYGRGAARPGAPPAPPPAARFTFA